MSFCTFMQYIVAQLCGNENQSVRLAAITMPEAAMNPSSVSAAFFHSDAGKRCAAAAKPSAAQSTGKSSAMIASTERLGVTPASVQLVQPLLADARACLIAQLFVRVAQIVQGVEIIRIYRDCLLE